MGKSDTESLEKLLERLFDDEDEEDVDIIRLPRGPRFPWDSCCTQSYANYG